LLLTILFIPSQTGSTKLPSRMPNFFWLDPIDFPSKMVPSSFSLHRHFLVLEPHLKAMGSIYGSHPRGLPYFMTLSVGLYNSMGYGPKV
jgi:hypothetical protein